MTMRLFLSSIAFSITLSVAALEVTVYTQNANCDGNNGSATAFVDTLSGGGPPFTYEWGPGSINGQGTYQVQELAPGDYYITVIDGEGTSVTENFTITGQSGLFTDGTVTQTIVSCFEDCAASYYISNSAFGGAGPYTATIDPPGAVVTAGFSAVSISGLCEGGPYSLTVTDSQGCSAEILINEVIIVEPLQLLQQTVTASCPNGETGTLQLLFDRPVLLYDHDTWQSLADDSVAYHDITGLPPGDLNLFAMGGGPACIDSMTFTITIPSSTDNCGTISGTVYADLNGDCIQQPDEPSLPNRTLLITPEPEDLVITDANGYYSRDRNLGSHELHFSLPDHFPVCPSSLPFAFELTTSEPIIQQDIAMQYLYPSHDASVHVSAFPPRIADTTGIWVTVTNNSPYAVPGAELQFTYSTLQTFVTSSVAPLTVAPGLLTWQLPEIGPYTIWQVSVQLSLPIDVELIGEVVNYQAQMMQPVPDADPSNDIHQVIDLIVAAYDPNDKLATATNSQSNTHYHLGLDQTIDYTIRFQNTGNAPAEHVYLIDTISDLHSLPSLQILGASHEFEVQWLEDRVLRFDFPQIMLPDSATDPMGSQGFVSFRLNHLEIVFIPGYSITNAADIYFDMNPPIRTNTTDLIAIDPSSVQEDGADPQFLVFPNPANDQLTFRLSDQQEAHWQVIGVDGRRVLSGRAASGTSVIGIQALSQGSYILRIEAADGRTHKARFIKQ